MGVNYKVSSLARAVSDFGLPNRSTQSVVVYDALDFHNQSCDGSRNASSVCWLSHPGGAAGP